MGERIVAEAFHPGEMLADELEARGLSPMDLAFRMGGKTHHEVSIDLLAVQLLLEVDEPGLLVGADMSRKLGEAFEIDRDYFLNIDASWQQFAANRKPSEPSHD